MKEQILSTGFWRTAAAGLVAGTVVLSGCNGQDRTPEAESEPQDSPSAPSTPATDSEPETAPKPDTDSETSPPAPEKPVEPSDPSEGEGEQEEGSPNEAADPQQAEPQEEAERADQEGLDPELVAQGKKLYQQRCATCHGTDGKGEGPVAQALQTKPRDHTNPEWQADITDQELRKVIQKGGSAIGLSATMPPHSDLDDDQLAALIAYVRSLKDDKS